MTWKVFPYYNVNPFIGGCLHDTMVTVPLPPFSLPGKLWHIDFSVVQGLWLGCFLSNGRDREVISDNLLFLGRMSDAGFVLPHISIPPSWYNILTTLFGGSNALFGVGSVTLACKNLLWGNEDCDLAASPIPYTPISINLQCGDPFSTPTDVVVVWGSLYAGMSLADIYSALIDLAVQWVMEGAILVGGKLMSSSFKKLGKKLGKSTGKAATKQTLKKAQKNAKKGFFATVGDKLSTYVKKASGATASDAYKEYLEKAARVKGIKEALGESVSGMSDDELAAFVRKTGGFSENLDTVTRQFTEGYDSYVKKYGSQVDTKKIEYSAFNAATDEIDNLKRLDDGVDDVAANFVVTNTTLKEALQSLDSAVAKVAKEEVAWAGMVKLLTKSFSKLVVGQLLRGGNALGSGTTGGVFSFEGLGWTDYFQRTLRFQDKWYASTSGADEYEDETSAFQEYAGFDESDDDYWYAEASTPSESTGSSSDSGDEDEYWYGQETGASEDA